jgi:hypothetical protein
MGGVLGLGFLLMACGDSSAAGVDVGSGAAAGFQGGSGPGGSGGAGALPGSYEFTCTIPGAPLPLPVQIIIETADFDGALEAGQASTLTTQLSYIIVSNNLAVGLDLPGSIADVRATVVVEGATPGEIAHSAQGLPLDAQLYRFDSDVVVTDSITPLAGSTAVQISVSAFTIRLIELPTAFFPGGELQIVAGEGDCGGIVASEGSGPLLFPVRDAAGE